MEFFCNSSFFYNDLCVIDTYTVVKLGSINGNIYYLISKTFHPKYETTSFTASWYYTQTTNVKWKRIIKSTDSHK